MYKNPADLENYVDGLRKAGMSEKRASKNAGA
jgi:hypothetical protein